MKKLMFAATAMLCGAVMAEITSANVVGYQTSDITTGRFNMISVPFVNVSDPAAGLQLNSDVSFANVTASADDSELADQIWVWEPSRNAYSQFFRYAGDGGEYPAGWCDLNDADWNYIEDMPGYENGLPLGSAIYYKAKNDKTGKAMTGSGAVDGNDEIELAIVGNRFNMISNPYPTALQLNDADQVLIKNPTANADDSELADQIWVWEPSRNAYSQFFYYAGDGAEYPAGWCDLNDADWNYIQDCAGYEDGIASGKGMYYKAKAGAGKSAVFTSPLAK